MNPAVVDTNVVVSGLLTAAERAPTARILGAMIAGRLRFLLSIELLAEYREVLLRPKIRSRHGLTEQEVDRVLADVAASGMVLEGDRLGRRPDGDDGHLWQILESAPDAVLVTGDRRLLEDGRAPERVMSPSVFVRRLRGVVDF